MKNIFFVDSENVGDSWIELFDYLNDEDIILVFYTDKSPNMSYKKKPGQKNVRRKIFTTHIHFILQLLFFRACDYIRHDSSSSRHHICVCPFFYPLPYL